MFELGNINFIAELLIAQTLLLYACPKRKRFYIRLILSVLGCLVLAYFFPSARISNPYGYQMYQLLRFLVLLLYTIIAAFVCYKISLQSLFSLCVAGYAIQHIAYQSTMLLGRIPFIGEINVQILGMTSILELIVFATIYVCSWLLFGRVIAQKEYYKNSNIRFDILSIAIIFICMVLTRFSYMLSGFNSLSPRLYAIVCCSLALIIQFNLYSMMSEKYEKDTIQQLWKEERKHYELSKQMVDTINIKCHDLKYKLREHSEKLSLEERKSLENCINIYDGMVKTGNEVLDVILSENYLQCQVNNIKFTFMGDGEALAFISPSDMYSLFGNALDNAREAVADLEEKKRVINLTVTKKGEFINIDLVNYFSGELIYVNDVLMTTKAQEEGYHGFGIKSMQLIAKKYGGDVRISLKENMFNLGIYLFIGTSQNKQ